jgi:hypothetical protein
MTQRWFVRAALAAVLGLGAAGLARAQAPAPPPNLEPWAVIEYGSAGEPRQAPAPAAEAQAAHSKGLIRDWLHNRPKPVQDHVHDTMHAHGVGCWSHFNAYTCSSWKSECTFIFGSCREFFGEPCLPGPPQPPMPPGYGPLYPPPGYGTKSKCPNCQ